MKTRYKILITLVVLVALAIALSYFFYRDKTSNMIYGVSFQTDYAEYLGEDYQAVFKTILDEWNFRYLRLMAQWDSLEPKSGEFNFEKLDWLMDAAGQRKAKVILAVGQKTPRWPECHAPDWTKDLNDEEYFFALHRYIAATAERYKNHPALEIWQVENEPFLAFGEKCRKLSTVEFKKEIANVRALDDVHKILTADSGELSTWQRTARAGDFFGTTLYRMVWNRYIGYWSYDWVPPAFYKFKLWLARQIPGNAFVVELQAEPWIPGKPINAVSIEEQSKSMNLARLKKSLDFVERLQFSRTYLWGAEWWYWLKKQNSNEIPDFIRDLPKNP